MDKAQMETTLASALEAGTLAEQEGLAKEAVEQFENESFGYYYLAEALVNQDPPNFPKAEVCLAKAIELTPDSTLYMLRFADMKMAQSQTIDAQIILKKLVDTQPDNLEALYRLAGIAQFLEQDAEASLQYCNAMLDAQSDFTPALLLRAEAKHALDQLEEALLDVNAGLQDGFNEGGAVLKVTLLKKLNQTEALVEAFDSLVTERPDVAAYRNNYGQELLSQGKANAAATQLKVAVELEEGEDENLSRIYGEALLLDKQYEAARATLETCNDAEARLMLLECYNALNAYDETIKIAQTLKADQADEKNVLEAIQIHEARALIGNGKADQAEAILVPIAKNRGLSQGAAYFALSELYWSKKDENKTYRFAKAAAQSGITEASVFIREHLNTFVQGLQDKVLAAYSSVFEANAENKMLQHLFGKVWVFDDLKSSKLDNLEAAYIENIKASMLNTAIVITAKGAMVFAGNAAELVTYKVEKGNDKAVILEFAPLDELPTFKVKLQATANGFSFSKAKNEEMLFSAVEEPTESLKAAVQSALNQDDLAFLGDLATTAINSLWTK